MSFRKDHLMKKYQIKHSVFERNVMKSICIKVRASNLQARQAEKAWKEDVLSTLTDLRTAYVTMKVPACKSHPARFIACECDKDDTVATMSWLAYQAHGCEWSPYNITVY